jgi:hypothetical protein
MEEGVCFKQFCVSGESPAAQFSSDDPHGKVSRVSRQICRKTLSRARCSLAVVHTRCHTNTPPGITCVCAVVRSEICKARLLAGGDCRPLQTANHVPLAVLEIFGGFEIVMMPRLVNAPARLLTVSAGWVVRLTKNKPAVTAGGLIR